MRAPRPWSPRLRADRRNPAPSRPDPKHHPTHDHPVISAEQAEDLTGALTSSVYTALDRLEGAGIIHPITARKRNKVWGVNAIIDELDDLNNRIVRRVQDNEERSCP